VVQFGAEILEGSTALADTSFVREWTVRTAGLSSPHRLFQSPAWIAHAVSMGSIAPPAIAVVREADGRLAGIVPVFHGKRTLHFDVKARRLWSADFRAIDVRGPLMLDDAAGAFASILEALEERYRDAFDAVIWEDLPTESYWWPQLRRENGVRQRYIVHAPDAPVNNWLVTLPESFDEYLKQFSRKTRYNLGRQVRLLSEHASGRLEVVKFERQADVELFLAEAGRVAAVSWQGVLVGDRVTANEHWKAKLMSLASHGLLRSYLLRCNGTAIAYVFGYEYERVYHYVEVGYDPAAAEWSPGSVLLYLLVKDLIECGRIGTLYFGFGEIFYKKRFGNTTFPSTSVWLLRKTLSNRLHSFNHTAFRRGLAVARRCFGRRSE
jgi:CelD/BcsL family acetyltransferase involved in cellulose biosynthesis